MLNKFNSLSLNKDFTECFYRFKLPYPCIFETEKMISVELPSFKNNDFVSRPCFFLKKKRLPELKARDQFHLIVAAMQQLPTRTTLCQMNMWEEKEPLMKLF